MPNLSFGQNSDPSGLFSGLSRNYLLDQEALLRDAAERNREVQDAQDKDTFDKWKNGMISDDDWLAYISQRVEETKGDSKQNQSWVELQREYTIAIADDKAEFQYQNGEITIHQLIAYYETRRKGLDKDSQEWREVTLRINEYVDKATSADITAGAQDIADRIAVGSATLADLKAFYEGKLRGLRKNSPLYEQISAEIRDLQSQMIAGGYSASGGGGGGSSRSRGNGGLSAYESYALATDSGFIQPDEILMDRAYRDARGVSSSASGFSGFIDGYTEKETDDLLDAQSTYYQNILKQWGDSDVAYDPHTGEPIDGTPENRRAIAFQLIDSLEMQRIAKVTGNSVDASDEEDLYYRIGQAMTDYILPANALEFEQEAMPIFQRALEGQMAALENSSNFGGTVNMAVGNIQLLDKLINRQTRKRTRFLETSDESPYGEKFGAAKPFSGLPTETLEYLQRVRDGLSLVAMGDVDKTTSWLAENNDIDFLAGENGVVTRAHALQSTARNLNDGVSELVYDQDRGGLVEAPISSYDSGRSQLNEQTGRYERIPVTFVDYKSAGISYDTKAGDEEVYILIDGPDGRPVRVRAVARRIPVTGKIRITDREGNTLTAADIQRLSSAGLLQQQLSDGTLKEAPAGDVLSVSYVRDDGRRVTMYRDDTSMGWSGRPMIQTTEDVIPGVVTADANGQLLKRSKPFSHAYEVPMPYFGDNAEELQRMIDRGEIDVSGMLFVGPDGNPTGELVDLTGHYYDDSFQKKGYSYADPELSDFRRNRASESWNTKHNFMEGADQQDVEQSVGGRSRGGGWENNSLTEGPLLTGIKSLMGAIGVFTSDYYSGRRPVWQPFANDKAGSALGKLSLTERYANYRPGPGDVRRANAARAASDALPKVTLPRPNTKPVSSLSKLPSATTQRIVSRETLARRAGIVQTQKSPVALPKTPVPTKTTSTIAKSPTTTTTVRRPAYRQPSRY